MTIHGASRRTLRSFCRLFTTEDVTFREIGDSGVTHHVQNLRPVVHAMRDDMRDAGPEGFLAWWLIEMIGPQFIPRAGIGYAAGNAAEVNSRNL